MSGVVVETLLRYTLKSTCDSSLVQIFYLVMIKTQRMSTYSAVVSITVSDVVELVLSV